MRLALFALLLTSLLVLGCVQPTPTPAPTLAPTAAPTVATPTPQPTVLPTATQAPTPVPTVEVEATPTATPQPTVLKGYYCNRDPNFPPQNTCEKDKATGEPTGFYCNQYLTLEYACVKCGCPPGKTCNEQLNICR